MRVDSLEPAASTNESVLNIASRRQTGESCDLMTRFFQSPRLHIILNKVKKRTWDVLTGITIVSHMDYRLYISGKGWIRRWCCRPPAWVKQIINVTMFKYILGGMGKYACAKWVLIFPYVEMCLQHRVLVQITRVGQCWRDGCQNKLWDFFHFQQDLELEAPTWTGRHLQTSLDCVIFALTKL